MRTLTHSIFASQFHAAFGMLTQTIEACPESEWVRTHGKSPFWQIAYHALFYGDFYLHRNEAEFRPWRLHREDIQFLGGKWGPDGKPPAVAPVYEPYARGDVLDYARNCIERIDSLVDALDLEAPDCGFWWYKLSKLEHQFVNLRHLAHHTGQLADRLRAAADLGIEWIGSGARKSEKSE